MAFALCAFFWAVATITVGILLGRDWWLPELISVHGASIARQLGITLALAGIVFFLAQLALGYFIWRFRGRGTERASYWDENSKLEATWTIITLVIFIGLGIEGDRIWDSYFMAQP